MDYSNLKNIFRGNRYCSLNVAPMVDHRPKNETYDHNQKSASLFLPLILINIFNTAGPVFGEASNYDPHLRKSIDSLLKESLKLTNICSGKGKRYTLYPELKHYYGVRYEKNSFLIAAGIGLVSKFEFFPSAHVAFQLTLKETDTGKVVSTRYISENYLFNPTDPGLNINTSAFGPGAEILKATTRVPTIALHRLLTRLPYELETMLAQDHDIKVDQDSDPESFMLVRLTKEYDFNEIVIIEIKTGRILFNKITRRIFPIMSKPNEWVVAPVSVKTRRWLNKNDYHNLLNILNKFYKVSFKGNLTAATFSGVRDPKPDPVK
ncbi:hypothetical protein KKD49_05680 [Myxococcota bacterium]|nr:hypothetical protein [Myxococcota bacterium]